MPGHILARGGLTDGPALEEYLLELAGVARPRICFLDTVSAQKPEYVELFYDRFRAPTCEPAHVELSRHAGATGGDGRAPGCGLRGRREHRERARICAPTRSTWRSARCGSTAASSAAGAPAAALPQHDPRAMLPPALAADDDAVVHFEGAELHEVVSQREGACAYRRRAAAGGAAAVKRVVVMASASCSGKTTLGRELARRLDGRFVELDALNHGPNWVQATPEELRAHVEPLLDEPRWVVDGSYRSKLGDLVLERADVVVWLDLPVRVWLPRLMRRTLGRIVRKERLWNDNRETLWNAFFSRDSLLRFALRTYPQRRWRYPAELGRYNLVRLRSPREVERWLQEVA